MDEYIIVDNGFTIEFLKNGKLHREVGPARFWKSESNRQQYLNMGDEHLYQMKIKTLRESEKTNYYLLRLTRKNNKVHYALEGNLYSKQEFDSILLRKELKSENNINTKKVKL